MMPQSIHQTAARILLIDDQIEAAENLARQLGYEVVGDLPKSAGVNVPSGVLQLTEIAFHSNHLAREICLFWLNTSQVISGSVYDALLEYLNLHFDGFDLILLDLSWSDEDPITAADIKFNGTEVASPIQQASALLRLNDGSAGPCSMILRRLGNGGGDFGRQLLARTVIYSVHVESCGTFVPRSKLGAWSTAVEVNPPSINWLGASLIGSNDILGLIGKDAHNDDKIRAAVAEALEMVFNRPSAPAEPAPITVTPRFVGRRMQEILGSVHFTKIGRADTPTVLIRGETGTGKELAAKAINEMSVRRSGPFKTVNCAALPPSLIESELFGHESGSFTGATGRRLGKFEQCHGGTLFLDELGELEPIVQGKVLRVVEGHPFTRLGGNEEVRVDVRLIAATNRDLQAMITEGTFRGDLYFRLSAFEIFLPPLRDRREDIPELIASFLLRFNHRYSRALEFTPQALRMLSSNYDWPGNVRELENFVARRVVIHPSDSYTDADAEEFVRSNQHPPLTNNSILQGLGSGIGFDSREARDQIVRIAQLLGVTAAKDWARSYLQRNPEAVSADGRKIWLGILDEVTAQDSFIAAFNRLKPGSGRKPHRS